MRKMWAVAVVMAIALLWFAVPATAAPPSSSGTLRFDISIEFTDPQFYWWGSAQGGINGLVKYEGNPDDPNWFGGVSPAAHFHEVFTICPGFSGAPEACTTESTSYITGVDEGVYLFLSGSGKWHFMANGWVTGASPDYAYLIGYKYFENGWTTDPNAATLPIHGEAAAFMAPM